MGRGDLKRTGGRSGSQGSSVPGPGSTSHMDHDNKDDSHRTLCSSIPNYPIRTGRLPFSFWWKVGGVL